MAEVRLEHVYKTYKRGHVEAVQDLNLTIKDGEFLALLGPSGCGKTSTLRMIVGLEEITRGQISIGNRVVNEVEPKDRNVALAFETYALYPPLTIRENISFCLRAKALPANEIDRRVTDVAEMLNITDILGRKPGEIGGGQKQRVSLARALVREPDVMLLDEPLSHLDASQRARMRVELKRMHVTLRRTTVLVTHDQLEAVAMAERVAIMNLGVLQQVGTFNEIFYHPVNEFVAGFIGEPPMNMLPCAPESAGDEMFLRAEDGSFRLKLTPDLRTSVLKKSPKKTMLGVRPIHFDAQASSQGNGRLELPGNVFTYESLGEEGQLAVRIGESIVLVVTPPDRRFSENQDVWLQARSDRIHLFDSDTGLTI